MAGVGLPPSPLALVGGGLLLVVGLVLLRAAVRSWRKALTVGRARSKSVADLADGDLVTVEGEAVALTDERVPAHFHRDEGLAVATMVKGKSAGAGGRSAGGTGGGETWTTVHTDFEWAPFAVDDGTGRVRVVPPERGAFPSEGSFDESVRLDADSFYSPTPRAEAYAEYADAEGPLDTGDRRFDQGVLRAGEEAWVLGRVTTDEDGERVVGYERNPAAFTLSTGSRPSVLGAVLLGVFVGLLGLALGGAGAVLFGDAVLAWLG